MSGILTVGLVGAGVAAYGVSQQSKAAKTAANNQRNLGSEVGGVAGAAPELLKLGGKYDYLAGARQQDFAEDWAAQAMRMYPQLAEMERKATSLQRTDDVRDLRKLGGQFKTELNKVMPGWGQALGAVNDRVQTAGNRSELLRMLIGDAENAGPSGIRSELESQAQDELALGGQLSAQESRDAVQQARAGWADRGLLGSNPAVIAEVLNRDAFARVRQGERRNFAAGVQDLGMREDAQNRGFQQSVEGQAQSELDSERAFVSNAVGINQNALAPVLSFMGRTTVSPTAGGALLSSAPNMQGTSNQLLTSLLGYQGDVADTNFNAIESRANAQANSGAAMTSAALQGVGSVAGAYYGNPARAKSPPKAQTGWFY